MSTIADSLLNLVCALGGADNPQSVRGSNISEIIDEISKNVSGAAKNIYLEGPTAQMTASANTIYIVNGTATEIELLDAEGDPWTLIFESGATPTVLTGFTGIHMPDDFSVEANRRYEITVFNGYAAVSSWGVE